MQQVMLNVRPKEERAFLVGVDRNDTGGIWPINNSLDELSSLAKAAGASVVGQLIQKLEVPSFTHYLGKGKLEELKSLKEKYHYDVIIINDELRPRQQSNLEEILEVKVIDRTALILDIFAKRAHSREGQLQVELAQHQYILPRLAGQWSHLERLGGGIGTRGPGESQLETDRRLIRSRIKRLKDQLEAVRRHRTLYREKRKKSNIPVVSLVGYTNAGKSTLLNALSHAGVVVEDRLFTTLDPVTRSFMLPDSRKILITDTVGFIDRLPPSIVAAFRATLEEFAEADLLLHLIDINHPNAADQYETVNKILSKLKLNAKKQIIILNKVDLMVEKQDDLSVIKLPLEIPEHNMILISAYKKWGLDKLVAKIEIILRS